MPAFTAEVYQNEYLSVGGTQVHAIITVRATGQPAPPRLPADVSAATLGATLGATRADAVPQAPELAEVLLIDCSGSMANPPAKAVAAKQAAQAAIDCLPDGVWFAVVRGTGAATLVYPRGPALVAASARTRAEAKSALAAVPAHGGTAIGRWLTLARQLLATRPEAIGHAILLTDGENGELQADFEAAVAACAGRFQCDCRGIGADWRVDELRHVAVSLLGTVDAVREPAELAADFARLVEAATSRAIDRVSLRVWTPQGARVRFLHEVAPTLRELDGIPDTVDGRATDFRTGAWGAESRDYHLHVEVPAKDVGTEMLAARVGLVVEDQVVSTALVRAVWTSDADLSMRISTEVAHYTGQAELARTLQRGLEARKAGDDVTATLMLGRSAQLARVGGNDATYRLLQKVVEIDDPTAGTVRLKKDVEKIDEMVLDTRSTMTVRVNR